MDVMTPEEFATKMREIAKMAGDGDADHGDQEAAHSEGDGLMMDVLRSLGYAEGVEIFRNTPKWYA